jgi:hypothetical protein
MVISNPYPTLQPALSAAAGPIRSHFQTWHSLAAPKRLLITTYISGEPQTQKKRSDTTFTCFALVPENKFVYTFLLPVLVLKQKETISEYSMEVTSQSQRSVDATWLAKEFPYEIGEDLQYDPMSCTSLLRWPTEVQSQYNQSTSNLEVTAQNITYIDVNQ